MILFLKAAALWSVLAVSALLGAVLGVVASSWASGYARRELEKEWRPNLGLFLGMGLGVIAGAIGGSPVFSFFVGATLAYVISRFPKMMVAEKREEPKRLGTDGSTDRMQFRKEWNARPRFESGEEGLFVGREVFLNRLTSHFISKGGGTILVSGVRGVGKTALVERALVDARQKLQRRYWKNTFDNYYRHLTRWNLIEQQVRRTLLELAGLRMAPQTDDEFEALKKRLDEYAKRTTHRFWHTLNPIAVRLRRMHEASRSQLFVLKFSASDISGALAEPQQKSTEKPQIDPERLLRAVIRKFFMTCHSSRQEPEAKILQWSLDKRVRPLFFQTLENSYNKSISKSYKEIVTNSLNDFLKKSQSSVYEGKMNLERTVLLLLCLALSVGAAVVGGKANWYPVQSFIASGAGLAVAGYFAVSWTFKRSRETGSERSRQSQFSYEYDYSLDQMQRDVESIVRILHPPEPGEDDDGKRGVVKFDPYRCFRRSAVIFDELDKLGDPDKQLDNVITHFKNFFTLSQAEFVFLTDQTFYEHLLKETVKAQGQRRYPPQHTFFTEKLYLSKPEFPRFREAFYRFAPDDWISKRANIIPPDPVLAKYLLLKEQKLLPPEEYWPTVIKSLHLQTLTQLFIQREQFSKSQKTLIELEFKEKNGWRDPLAVAHIWCSQVSSATTVTDFPETRRAFNGSRGWENPDAVALLYYYRDDFGPADLKLITDNYGLHGSPSLAKYTTVDEAPFTLSDLARALCFQTRNHYFDLYNSVYDYVHSYEDGAPVLPLENGKFALEPRLWSRYQQLLEIAFDSAKENQTSREYFNTLLMESLYKVFDTRSNADEILVSKVLFAANGLPTAPAINGKRAEKVKAAEGSSFTGRDAEKINQAIVRLLRLALAHEAIISTDMEASFKNEKVKSQEIANFKFSWKDNSLSIIRADEAEQHEQALIDFWDKFEPELQALDTELTQLWLNAQITGEGARMQQFIAELRSKVGELRQRTGKVSRADALALKSNLGTTTSRNELIPRIVLERIKSEGDAEIIEDVETSKTQMDSKLEARKKAFELSTQLRARAVICPRETNCFVYLVASAIPVGFDLKTLILEDENSYLFWYLLGGNIPPFAGSANIFFYAPPPAPASAVKLFTQYVQVASRARLRHLIERWLVSKDKSLALAAAAELAGSIKSNSEIIRQLGRQDLGAIINVLAQLRDRFSQLKLEAWKNIEPLRPGAKSYPIEIRTDWSLAYAVKALAKHLGKDIPSNSDETLTAELLIERVLIAAVPGDTSSWTVDSWTRSFISMSADPALLGRLLLAELVRVEIEKKYKSVERHMPRLESAARTEFLSLVSEFASMLGQQIVEIAKTRVLDLVTIASASDLPLELEKYRRSLKPSPTTDAPVTTPGSVPKSPRIRRTRKAKQSQP